MTSLRLLLLLLTLVCSAVAETPLLKLGGWLPTGAFHLQVSPDGKLLLLAPHYYEDPGRNLELWDITTGTRVAELHAPAQHISARFLPGGQIAAIIEVNEENGSQSSHGYCWSGTGKPLATPLPLWGQLADQPMLLDKDTVVLSSWENHEQGDADGGRRWAQGRVQSWNWARGQVTNLAGVQARVQHCAVTGDGRWVVTLGGDSMLGVWDSRNGRRMARQFRVSQFALSSHSGRVRIDGQPCALPSLKPVGVKGNHRETYRSAAHLYELDGGSLQLLDPLTLRARFPVRIQASPGFSQVSSATPLPAGRLLLWDATHRASAIAFPERR